MKKDQGIYIGTDSGATTSKVGGVWADGTTISTKLLQRPTGSQNGPDAVVHNWVEAITGFLQQNSLSWDKVLGVGLAIPGPFQRYGVLGRSPNLPAVFEGWDVHNAYSNALATRAGRAIPLTVGNDGNYGGVAEAQHARGRNVQGHIALHLHCSDDKGAGRNEYCSATVTGTGVDRGLQGNCIEVGLIALGAVVANVIDACAQIRSTLDEFGTRRGSWSTVDYAGCNHGACCRQHEFAQPFAPRQE